MAEILLFLSKTSALTAGRPLPSRSWMFLIRMVIEWFANNSYMNLLKKNNISPKPEQTAEIIQKRIVTLVSGQPRASK